KHFVGSGVLNLLQSQAKAMASDNSVRSLLEKMTECASNAYLSILERMNLNALGLKSKNRTRRMLDAMKRMLAVMQSIEKL
ncbi:hypothetical protein AALP_AAs46848U000100, partial [Arabis alpina]